MILIKNIVSVNIQKLDDEISASSFDEQFYGITCREEGKIEIYLNNNFEKHDELNSIIDNHVP